MRRAAILCAVVLAGCGSSSTGGGVTVPKVQPAAQFTLANFTPTGTVKPGKPVTISFRIKMPDGKTLTSFRTGPGPHTGVHLIIVRDDLAEIIHQHPPVEPTGVFTQKVTFAAPGPYRVLVDVYPNLPGVLPNFQLFGKVTVAGAYHPVKLPPFSPNLDIDGYHFRMLPHPAVHAIQAEFLHVNVTTPQGKPVNFVPWFGALAHAIFFHQGSLDYFHTHICAPNAPNCGSLAGVPITRVTGHATHGKLTVGVLLPVPGTWRLFLQLRQGSKIITAPYTLDVK
ncbi:MAG TPA: hypothetical protein VG410_13910 [Solirubrobacteraceae bacterium]|nr:hypothetical protein [Solirubrobacteraceae bacterium]